MVRFGVSTFLVFALWAASALTSIAQTASPLPPQQPTKRLILKDGSFQPVVKYEIQGDRVHYFSAERYEWEDIPSSLMDWEATKKYEADFSTGKLRVHVETPEEREEREKEEANSPEISPGSALAGNRRRVSSRSVRRQTRAGGDPAEWQRIEPERQQEERPAHRHQSRSAARNIHSS